MEKKLLIIFIFILSISLLIACQSLSNNQESETSKPASNTIDDTTQNSDDTTQNSEDASSITETTNPSETNQTEPPTSNELSDAELAELNVNELGDIMVLMYHVIGDKEAEWERTVSNFRNDLQVLYDEDYYLVNARDFVTGNLNVPAGKTPVVLTFDDATEGHFRFFESADGQLIVDPDCAVGILESFYNENPDFGLAATFFVYYPVPFRQIDRPEWRQKKFDYINDLGMEIGNHTYGHEFLNRITDEEVQKTLVKNIKATQSYLPNYSVDTFALTYGIYPLNRELAVSGKYDDFAYEHKGVFLVGSHPAPSPFSQDFKSEAIPRIRAASVPEDFFKQWIEHFRERPERRYVSDGDPKTVTVPYELNDKISEHTSDNFNVRVYKN